MTPLRRPDERFTVSKGPVIVLKGYSRLLMCVADDLRGRRIDLARRSGSA